MKPWKILAAVLAMAATGAACAKSPIGPDSAMSALSESGGVTTAAKGGGGGKKGGGGTSGTSSLTLAMVIDVNGDGLPNYGDTITFKVSTTATTEPTVDLNCYQNNTLVLSATTGYYASYPWPSTNNMMLASGAWTSGSASCNATLHALGSSTVLASLNFTAGA